MILAFALGAVLGNLAIAQWGTWAILGSSALLLVCFGLMFFQERKGKVMAQLELHDLTPCSTPGRRPPR